MGLKPGYKQTEAGAIPEDWQAKKLGNFVSLQRGHDLTEPERRPGNVAVMGSAGQNGFHDIALARGPGVVVGRSGASFGQVHFCENDYWPHNTALYVTDFHGNDPRFAFYFLKALDFSRYNSGGAQQSLNRNFIYPIPIGVPDLDEQRHIAAVLSDVDALIASLDQLIAKKCDIKQAAMQQLLTAKLRLPGFSAKWKKCLLSELGYFSKGRGIKKDQQVPDGKPCVRYGEIYTRHNDYIREFYSFISDEVGSGSQRLRKGDLLFAGSGETAEEIGKCVAFLGNGEAYAGGDIVIFTPSDQDSMYLGFLMNHASITRQKARMGQGDAVVHISAANLGRLELLLPPCPEEQTAIAKVLCDIDTEIAALEQRRDKTRLLKQGMMQELLTGKTRLI
ncbi:MAG: restriction endonuclease subunit S [Terriglobia bacterium]|jgi:type I restriction enzyme S subunit